ncbi:tyrosine-type recombinase/integrase [Rhizobium laguerreae]|uniref:tyrosine-type recombinase/integrase n=1 Tax=Rhizobium laguerreae TaxID=1076926 RepID=UPI0014797EA7|nr:tyrosine-type recombinase/integrase [Rhizobium laguerreae]NNH56963.1 tyrosine-type recombinase/integrase [Rhizobium laguerreae]
MPLKLYKRGKVWWISGTVHGQKVRETTGSNDKEVAEAIRIKKEAGLVSDHVYGPKATRDFSDAVTSYIEAGGERRYIGTPHSGLLGHFYSTPLKDIQQNDLDEAARTLYMTALPETRNRQCYTPFIAVWNHAVKNGWADMRLWSRPKKAKGTNVVRIAKRRAGTFPVDYEHAAKFIAAMSPGPAMLMTTLFYTGMRPIEIFALEAQEVNIAGRWITLTKTKTGEPRGIPIHEFIAPILESLLKRNSLAEDPRLFRTPKGEPYETIVTDEEGKGGGGLKTAINGARRRSGIKDIAPYTGRHSCSTGLVVAGVHPHIKDQILGHAADDMSRHYTNVPQAPLVDAINKLPVPEAWRALPWLDDPLAWSGKFAEGMGRRTDLDRKRREG